MKQKSIAELGIEVFKEYLWATYMGTKFPDIHIREASGADHEQIMRIFGPGITIPLEKLRADYHRVLAIMEQHE